jgi:hypothetical protein
MSDKERIAQQELSDLRFEAEKIERRLVELRESERKLDIFIELAREYGFDGGA